MNWFKKHWVASILLIILAILAVMMISFPVIRSDFVWIVIFTVAMYVLALLSRFLGVQAYDAKMRNKKGEMWIYYAVSLFSLLLMFGAFYLSLKFVHYENLFSREVHPSTTTKGRIVMEGESSPTPTPSSRDTDTSFHDEVDGADDVEAEKEKAIEEKVTADAKAEAAPLIAENASLKATLADRDKKLQELQKELDAEKANEVAAKAPAESVTPSIPDSGSVPSQPEAVATPTPTPASSEDALKGVQIIMHAPLEIKYPDGHVGERMVCRTDGPFAGLFHWKGDEKNWILCPPNALIHHGGGGEEWVSPFITFAATCPHKAKELEDGYVGEHPECAKPFHMKFMGMPPHGGHQ